MNSNYHIPVLLESSVNLLVENPEGIYVDCTFGGGGHSSKILEKLSDSGKLYAFDLDPEASKNSLDDKRFTLITQNFKFLTNFMQYYKVKELDGILVDLGVSSYQFDTPERGFSFRFDAELDMRMDSKQDLTAHYILNNYSTERLEMMFKEYGEIFFAKRLVEAIVKAREAKEIKTTKEFVSIIEPFVSKSKQSKFYAQVFQSLRIEVNDEIQTLKVFLNQSLELLRQGGILSVISYHSLEDRLVKRFMKTGDFNRIENEKDFYGNSYTPFQLVTKKPILPTPQEVDKNPRSRSAKLRVARKSIGRSI